LEILVETGIPGLLACLGLLASSLRQGLHQLNADDPGALAAIASLAAVAGLLMQGSTDTIFFRPEVQLIGWFSLATLVSRPGKS
jgi:putative inorganic carbon (HCO3(-)) transporter